MTAVKDAPGRQQNSDPMKDATTGYRDHRRSYSLCLGLIAAMAAIAATLMAFHATKPARAANVTLIYVGADDCAPCRTWLNGDGAPFRRSAEFARITYVEVKAPHLHDVLKDETWPLSVREFRTLLKQSDGVPLWLVVSNGDVIEQRFGPEAWRGSVLPIIRSALR